MTRKPSVAAIVHYISVNNRCRAAVVTDVNEDGVDLHVFDGVGILPVQAVTYSGEGHKPLTWHWPAPVE